jgi:hypothetical protein
VEGRLVSVKPPDPRTMIAAYFAHSTEVSCFSALKTSQIEAMLEQSVIVLERSGFLE